MMTASILFPILLTVLFPGTVREPVPVCPPVDPDPAYTEVIQSRSKNIVDMLAIEDEAKARLVQNLIADQYRTLGMLHDTCDAQIQAIQSEAGDTPDLAKSAIQALRDMTQALQGKLHTRYLLKLSALLTPAQVDQVKDGMTYGLVQVTYNSYLDLLPGLTEPQKAVIMAYLKEARELAMDASSSSEKHKWFGKYKGRINNYLSAQGYDLKKASQERNARQPKLSR